MAHATPHDLVITPRDRRFGRDDTKARWWLGGDPVATAFYNVLSITFPRGEAFFIDSVRAYKDGTPPRLEQEISAFIRQEVIHSREHIAFNRHVAEHGYDTTVIDGHVTDLIDWARAKGPMACLAKTMALEHFTAIFAQIMLREPMHMANTDPETRNLWMWHSTEEIEHKGVAFDTWMHATRNWSPLKRWWTRTRMMLAVSGKFAVHRTKDTLDLLRQDGFTGPKIWARFFWFAMVYPGILRKIGPTWLSFFRPGFHPWESDDRELIAAFEAEQAAPAQLAKA